MNDKKKLYLITEYYPYGDGEASFLEPELPYLKEFFDITIISVSVQDDRTCVTDSDIKVIHHDRHASAVRKLIACAGYFFCAEGWREIKDILSLKSRKGPAFWDSILSFGEAVRFERFLEKNKIIDDTQKCIVYTYWYFFPTLSVIRAYGDNDNVRIITRAHRCDLYDDAREGGRQPFKEYMNSSIDRIVFIAEHGREYFINRYSDQKDILDHKCCLYRLGVKREPDRLFDDKGCSGDSADDRLTGEGFNLVSCSLINERKRVDLIIRALAGINDIKINWIHFGDGPCNDDVRALAAELLDPKENIEYTFRGNVDTALIKQFYSENHVGAFITTSSSEGCPVSVQEAMAYGIPIIGTAVGDIPYMIRENGVLLDPDPSVEEIGNAIKKIIGEDKETAVKMRDASLFVWSSDYNSDKNFSEFAGFLNDLMRIG